MVFTRERGVALGIFLCMVAVIVLGVLVGVGVFDETPGDAPTSVPADPVPTQVTALV